MIKAAAIIFRYNDKVFAIKRQNSLNAFPGYHAFAGGKVDKEDYEQEYFSGETDFESTLLTAMTREIQEEMGCDLVNLVNRGVATKPELFGVAISPPFNPYKFETYYFLVNLNELLTFDLDPHEIEYGYWKNPEELLNLYNQGKILCVPPFIKILMALQENFEHYYDSEQIGSTIYDFSLKVDEQNEIPMIEPISGVKHFFVPSNTLPPALFTNCFLVDELLIDPSPKSEEELTKLYCSLVNEQVRAIFITHHHPDHHQYAEQMGKKLNIPLMMSEATKRRGQTKYSAFNHSVIQIVQEGDVIGQWKGRPITIMAVPGHDEGQLAPYAQNGEWFIASDLFQYGATVVAGGDEGDMGTYQQTLKKVIEFDPKVVFPSHGIGVWGTHWLEVALEHTYMRNTQVKEALERGLDVEQMLVSLYAGVNPKLLKYAKKNILSHIDLIRRRDDEKS